MSGGVFFFVFFFKFPRWFPGWEPLPYKGQFLLRELKKQKMAQVVKAAQSLKGLHSIFLSVSIYHNT